MSRHARENPEKYEDRDYSYANDLLRKADELREERKLKRRPAPGAEGTPKPKGTHV